MDGRATGGPADRWRDPGGGGMDGWMDGWIGMERKAMPHSNQPSSKMTPSPKGGKAMNCVCVVYERFASMSNGRKRGIDEGSKQPMQGMTLRSRTRLAFLPRSAAGLPPSCDPR